MNIPNEFITTPLDPFFSKIPTNGYNGKEKAQ